MEQLRFDTHCSRYSNEQNRQNFCLHKTYILVRGRKKEGRGREGGEGIGRGEKGRGRGKKRKPCSLITMASERREAGKENMECRVRVL